LTTPSIDVSGAEGIRFIITSLSTYPLPSPCRVEEKLEPLTTVEDIPGVGADETVLNNELPVNLLTPNASEHSIELETCNDLHPFDQKSYPEHDEWNTGLRARRVSHTNKSGVAVDAPKFNAETRLTFEDKEDTSIMKDQREALLMRLFTEDVIAWVTASFRFTHSCIKG